MANHPNRSTWRTALPVPSPEEIKESRLKAGLTQARAAQIAGISGERVWSMWENEGKRPSSQSWELWLLRVDQHPHYILTPRVTP